MDNEALPEELVRFDQSFPELSHVIQEHLGSKRVRSLLLSRAKWLFMWLPTEEQKLFRQFVMAILEGK